MVCVGWPAAFVGTVTPPTGNVATVYEVPLITIVVASAGNNNTDVPNYPGAYNGVVSVASTDINDVKSSFSTYGAWVKISAPGSNIFSTIIFRLSGWRF